MTSQFTRNNSNKLAISIDTKIAAVHLPTRKELARAVARQLKAGIRTLPTDHLVSEATYLWDEDGNGIEIAFETPERGYIDVQDDKSPIKDADGNPHPFVASIQMDSLMAELSPEDDLNAPLPVGTRLGHIHIHATNLEEGMAFYADALGFQKQILSAEIGFADVATNFMPHILAFNVWSGANATLSDATHAGLQYFELQVPNQVEIDAIATRLTKRRIDFENDQSGTISVADPSGNRMLIKCAKT